MSKHFLRKTVGSWSAGTQVEIVDEQEDFVTVRILAGDLPLVDVTTDDLVERGKKREEITSN